MRWWGSLQISSIYNNGYEEAFGFTQKETEQMLIDYGMEDRIPEAKEWYDVKFPQAYWVNTSSNQIIKDMIWHADDAMKQELDILSKGGTIEKQIHEDITYDDIHESEDNLWNFLFFTGYMKKVSDRMSKTRKKYISP